MGVASSQRVCWEKCVGRRAAANEGVKGIGRKKRKKKTHTHERRTKQHKKEKQKKRNEPVEPVFVSNFYSKPHGSTQNSLHSSTRPLFPPPVRSALSHFVFGCWGLRRSCQSFRMHSFTFREVIPTPCRPPIMLYRARRGAQWEAARPVMRRARTVLRRNSNANTKKLECEIERNGTVTTQKVNRLLKSRSPTSIVPLASTPCGDINRTYRRPSKMSTLSVALPESNPWRVASSSIQRRAF